MRPTRPCTRLGSREATFSDHWTRMTSKTEAALDLSRLGLQFPCIRTTHLGSPAIFVISSSTAAAQTALVATRQFRDQSRDSKHNAMPTCHVRFFPASPSLSLRPLWASRRRPVPCIYYSLDLPRCARQAYVFGTLHVVNLELGLDRSLRIG